MKSGTQVVESERLKLFSAPPPATRRPFALEPTGFEEMTVEHDRIGKVLWCRFAFSSRPSFTWAVFRDIARVRAYVDQAFANAADEEAPIRWLVLGSEMPGVWNLGGDLDLFARLIRARDREALTRYARLACEAGYYFTTSFGRPIVTVSLVQGDALGGGFEAVLSSNLIVAERSAKFALPEILFNLFPGMGAYTFLARRIAPALAERMIMSGDTYTAEQLYAMGVVDVLAEDGDGMRAIRDYIHRHERRHNAHVAIYKARNVVNPVTLDEMLDIASIWVDAALRLEEADLRRMERLVAAQDRRRSKLQG
ncbi:MAG: crotonase/enoyl-CoA hydratase family protein [Rhodospirillales bacterium]|nr:crotonase/enoyl-CoA hydratase family protein [Rhodospirillales bacterium]